MEKIIRERALTRIKALEEAGKFINCISRILGEISVALYGSYARGDFNEWSDIDILIIAKDLPVNPLARLKRIHECLKKHPTIDPILVTIEEYQKMTTKQNPITVDVEKNGIILKDKLNILQKPSKPSVERI